MKGKVNRGFMFYLLLVFGALLAAFAICVVIMIFVPDFNLFGLRAYNENFKDITENKMAVYNTIDDDKSIGKFAIESENNIKTIEVDANVHSVRIIKSNEMQGLNHSQFLVIFNYRRIGFATEEVQKSNLSINYYKDIKTLRITATSPEGFLNFGGEASLFIQVPPEYNTSDIDLKINARQSVVVGDSHSEGNNFPSTVDFKSVNIKTEQDIVVTKYATVGKIAAKDCSFITQKGKITIDTPIKANNLVVEVENDSTIRINENSEKALNIAGDFEIKTKNAFVYIGDFTAGKTLLNNVYGKINFKNVASNVVIDKDSHKCDYQFKNITGSLTMGSYLDEYMVENGNITVEESVDGDILLATTGNIDIENASSSVKIKNTSGKIDIKSVGGDLNVRSVDGDISIGSEETRVKNRADILTTGKSNIKIYFGDFKYSNLLNSVVKASDGKVEINLIKDMDLNLKAKAGKTLEYLTVKIDKKEGVWKVGEDENIRELYVESNSDVRIFAETEFKEDPESIGT